MSNNCLFCKKSVYENNLCEYHYKIYKEQLKIINSENKRECDYKPHYHNLKHSIYKMINYPNIVELCIRLMAIAESFFQKYNRDELLKHVVADISVIIRYKVKQIKDNKFMMDNRYSALFNDIDFRSKWKQTFRTEDGHYVRSMAEQVIDNYLYHHNIAHAYEKIVIVPRESEAKIICDFYIPEIDTYIEYYGKYDGEYIARKYAKEQIYKENNINCIALTKKDLENLDDLLWKEIIIRRSHKKKGQQ